MGIFLINTKMLEDYVFDVRLNGGYIVWTNGCFDILHIGHAMLLNEAKAIDGRGKLIVGVNSDNSVRRIKGSNRPIISENDRASLLTYFAAVDAVVLFDTDTPIDMIKLVRPDIIVKGEDWRNKGIVGQEFVESYGGRIHLAKLHKGDTSATTNIIERVITIYTGAMNERC